VVRGSDIAVDGMTALTPWEADLHGYVGVACDLDGDGAPEWVTADGIWAGTDLLGPSPEPVAAGLAPRACLGAAGSSPRIDWRP
jgi:hypothetical protein